jgi:CDP-diacylglycerol--glycerol-3-phosphate 3-phosphatidyltransferase
MVRRPRDASGRRLRYEPSARITPANAVTVVRMLMTPVVLLLIAQREFDLATFLLWVVACSSDAIDGMLARSMGPTNSGAFLDPLADKVLVLGALVVLAAQGAFAWVWVVVIAGRELAISLYRSRLSARGVSLPARRSAKWKTAVQQIAVGLALLPWFGREWPWLAQGALLVAVVLTVWSGWLYLVDARRGRARSVAA